MSTGITVAIVGSGPSGFYAAKELFKQEALGATVHMFDRLPTPFGLVRGGVAPDHQSIKGVVRAYQKVAANSRFRFFGNICLGKDLQADELREKYDAVIWAVGNEDARKLGVPGEDLTGVHSATEFVFWYNGHPHFTNRQFDLKGSQRAVVVGNGNVSMDVARILVRSPEELATTDIADYALESLKDSGLTEVFVLGRRGPAQSAFSPKEIKEIAGLDDVDVLVSAADAALDNASAGWLERGDGPRNAPKNVAFIQECAEKGGSNAPKSVRCMFLVSPIEFLGENGRLTGVRLQKNRIEERNGRLRPVATEEIWEEKADLCFKAIGYRGTPIEGVPFDDGWGIIPNEEGRVQESRDGTLCQAEYVVGWAKRGPSGLIGTNGPDSKATVLKLVEDHQAGRLTAKGVPDIEGILTAKGGRPVSFEEWKALDAEEVRRGQAKGRVREKFVSIREMLDVLDALQ